GIFTERRAPAGVYRVDGGATPHASGRGVDVGCRGGGSGNWKALRPFTNGFLGHGGGAPIKDNSAVENMPFVVSGSARRGASAGDDGRGGGVAALNSSARCACSR